MLVRCGACSSPGNLRSSIDGNGVPTDGNFCDLGASERRDAIAVPEPAGGVRLRELLIENGATNAADWDLITATNLSADGRVVTGWARPQGHIRLPREVWNQTSQSFAFRAVIPEPSTALLLGLGLVGLGGSRQRQARRAPSNTRCE